MDRSMDATLLCDHLPLTVYPGISSIRAGDVGMFMPYCPWIMSSCELWADSIEALVFCQFLKQELSAVGAIKTTAGAQGPRSCCLHSILWFSWGGP